MRQLIQPFLILEKKLAIFWLSVPVLLILKIYQGDQSFFNTHLSHLAPNENWLDWYKWTYHFFATFFLLGIIPIGIIKVLFNQSLSTYGVQLGDWKFGLKATLIAFLVLVVPVYFSSLDPEHLSFYPLTSLATKSTSHFLAWSMCYLPHYIGWELFFRGYIGFETKNRFGTLTGIMIPTVLTTIMHIGKPAGETWGALFGGIYLSLLTFRTNSILYALLFHWYLGILNSYFCGI